MQRAHQLVDAYGKHFRTPEWNVLTVQLGVYFAIADGAKRGPNHVEDGWQPTPAARRYVAHQAPEIPPDGVACIVRARMVGLALRQGRARTPYTGFASALRPGSFVLGLDEHGRVEYADGLAAREREAALLIAMCIPQRWALDPDLSTSAAEASAALEARRDDLRLRGIHDQQAVEYLAALGAVVGTCPEAEAAAGEFHRYCIDRAEGGASPRDLSLRLCSATLCGTPLFEWNREPTGKIGAPGVPRFCPACFANATGSSVDAKRENLRKYRRRHDG